MANFAKAWVGFNLGDWCERIDVRDFIQKNYTPYEGDESFLAAPTARTRRLMAKLDAILKEAVTGKVESKQCGSIAYFF